MNIFQYINTYMFDPPCRSCVYFIYNISSGDCYCRLNNSVRANPVYLLYNHVNNQNKCNYNLYIYRSIEIFNSAMKYRYHIISKGVCI